MKTCCIKLEKTWWVDHALCSRVKQSFTKPSFRNRPICENQLLVLMRVNCIPIQCVNLCQQDSTRVGILIRRLAELYHDRIRPANFENMVMPFFQRAKSECKIESFHKTGRQKKIDCFIVDAFCFHCNTVLEAMGCFCHFCPCQEVRPSLTEEDIQRGIEKRELDELRPHYIKQKGFTVIVSWDCGLWIMYKIVTSVKEHILEMFPYRCSLAENQLWEEIKIAKLFGYVQCKKRVPNKLEPHSAKLPSLFKNTLVDRKSICKLMKQHAEEASSISQPQKMLISSFKLQNGTLITPLLLFYPELELVRKKVYFFVEHTPKKCFNKFVQSAVDK